jgi:integrase
MTGTVRQDPKNGTWNFQVTLTTGGERTNVRRRGFPKKKLAETALTELLAAYGKGDRRALKPPSNQLLSEYLTAWLTARRPGLKPSTADSYGVVIRAWIEPQLGKVALKDLTGQRISAWHTHLREHGARGSTPLGTRSVAYANRVLSMALAEAVESGAIGFDPMTAIPKRQRPTHRAAQHADRVWTGEQASRFLTLTRDDRLGALFALLLDSGCRRGEGLGVRWPDLAEDVVTFRRNRVIVGADVAEGTPKNDEVRSVDLHPQTVAALRRWRARQAAERLAAGPAWTDSGGYVFTDELGEPMRPDAVSARFERIVGGLDVPVIRLHDLRHTSATLALLAGVPVHVVAKRLGHKDPAVTLRVYSHLLPTSQRDAAAKIGAALYGET